MRKIKWKKGVRARDLQPVMRRALLIVDKVFEKYKKDLTVTCTGDGDHSTTSLHPWGYAFDVRTRNLSKKIKLKIYKEIEILFKKTPFEIIFHSTHFHIEHDPNNWKEVVF